MSEIKEQKRLYKPEAVRNPYFVVGFLLFLSGYCAYDLINQLRENSPNIFIIVFFVTSILLCSYPVYIHFTHYVYAEVKENSVTLRNHFQKWPKEILFDEITEIIANKKWWYDVVVRDSKGQKIVINAAIEPTDEFFNELITRAVNCKKIDLRNIKKAAPNLILYEKSER
ncbi:MAG TPA: hypothetical protein PLN06_11340 [Bacteroidales bacterium]|nr:hypothetical protein [Bacteroidales bacterium]